jgi:hypothetical protein
MTLARASRRRFWTRGSAIVPILSFVFSTSAGASLIGDEVRIQVSVVDTTFSVAEGVDPDFSYSSYNWNVESSSVVFWIAGVQNATLPAGVFFTLSDLDFTPPAVIVDASIVAADGLFTGAMDDILTVGADSILVDLGSFAGGSLSGVPGMEISLFTEAPEPAHAMLLLTGASVLLGASRARARRAI